MSEPAVRLVIFLGVFALVACWEAVAPRRVSLLGRWQRWPGNLGIVILDTVVVRLLFPIGTVGVALLAQAHGWGVLNVLVPPNWIAVILAVLALDLAIYGQHVAFHFIPPLWRLHRMHHADLEVDVTTGLRFHPGEIVLSVLIKSAVVLALGAPPLAVLIFEVLLNATAMFNHGNVRLAPATDRLLRLAMVTPDMHRVHHSLLRHETDSNFGFNLPWWDRLFRTYRAQPKAGHTDMVIGIDRFRAPDELRLDRMLLQPLRADPADPQRG